MEDRESPCPGLLPDCVGDADMEWAQYTEWLDREAAAGREPEPWDTGDDEPWDDPGPGDQGPAGPIFRNPVPAGSAPGGSVPAGPGRSLFTEDGAGDLMPPVPFLAALTEQAVGDVAALTG